MPVVLFLVATAVIAVQGWVVMLLVGALHSEVSQVPAISYGGALWVVALWAVLNGLGNAAKRH